MKMLRRACLAAEQARLAREKAVVDEAVALSLTREKFYLEQPEGAFEVSVVLRELKKSDDKRKKALKV